MEAHSEWHIMHNADRFHENGVIKYLCYDATSSEGFFCKFASTPKGTNEHAHKRLMVTSLAEYLRTTLLFLEACVIRS